MDMYVGWGWRCDTCPTLEMSSFLHRAHVHLHLSWYVDILYSGQCLRGYLVCARGDRRSFISPLVHGLRRRWCRRQWHGHWCRLRTFGFDIHVWVIPVVARVYDRGGVWDNHIHVCRLIQKHHRFRDMERSRTSLNGMMCGSWEERLGMNFSETILRHVLNHRQYHVHRSGAEVSAIKSTIEVWCAPHRS